MSSENRREERLLANFKRMSEQQQTKFLRFTQALAEDHDGRILKRIEATGIPPESPRYLDAALAVIDEIMPRPN
jgi:hypothetical protein